METKIQKYIKFKYKTFDLVRAREIILNKIKEIDIKIKDYAKSESYKNFIQSLESDKKKLINDLDLINNYKNILVSNANVRRKASKEILKAESILPPPIKEPRGVVVMRLNPLKITDNKNNYAGFGNFVMVASKYH
ncbi:MAG: hypothetical protein AABY32_03100 [Nanoarchaeota archaeon]